MFGVWCSFPLWSSLITPVHNDDFLFRIPFEFRLCTMNDTQCTVYFISSLFPKLSSLCCLTHLCPGGQIMHHPTSWLPESLCLPSFAWFLQKGDLSSFWATKAPLLAAARLSLLCTAATHIILLPTLSGKDHTLCNKVQ